MPDDHNEPHSFHPGRGWRTRLYGDSIADSPVDAIAYGSVAGNWRAVEFIHGDDGIPQLLPKALSNEIECACCGQSKPRNAFGKDPRKRNGLQSHCRACERGRVKRYSLRRASWFRDVNPTVNLQKTG